MQSGDDFFREFLFRMQNAYFNLFFFSLFMSPYARQFFCVWKWKSIVRVNLCD